MRKRKEPRRTIDLRKSRTKLSDRSANQVGLPEDVRVTYSEENNPHDG